MDKVNYIVIKDSPEAQSFIRDSLKKQRTINGRVALCIFLIGTCILSLDKFIRKQNERIEELGNEVKELKQMRGE